MEQFGVFEKAREMKAKGDLIGALYGSELYELLGFHRVTAVGEKESWAALMETFANMAGDVAADRIRDVESLAQSFGNEREETGFRLGFHVAMRLCMAGMNGGVW